MRVCIASAYAGKIPQKREDLFERLKRKCSWVFLAGPSDEKKINTADNFSYFTLKTNRTNVNPISESISAIGNYFLFRRRSIDVLVVFGVKLFPSVVIPARLAGIKRIICIVNGIGNLFIRNTIKEKLLRILALPSLWLSFHSSSDIIFQNIDDMKLLRALLKLPKGMCHLVNGSGVSLTKYPQAAINNYRTILMISRIMVEKGVNEFLRAAEEVKASQPEARIILIGAIEKQFEDKLGQRIQESVERGTIEYFSEVQNPLTFFQDCYLFVLPSYREGLPRTIIEAMAVGRPIITTDVPGCRETVIPYRNGYLVPVRESKAISEKIILLLNDHERGKAMGQESRKICEERYDEQIINEYIISVILGQERI